MSAVHRNRCYITASSDAPYQTHQRLLKDGRHLGSLHPLMLNHPQRVLTRRPNCKLCNDSGQNRHFQERTCMQEFTTTQSFSPELSAMAPTWACRAHRAIQSWRSDNYRQNLPETSNLTN